jgi:hypothetical protein
LVPEGEIAFAFASDVNAIADLGLAENTDLSACGQFPKRRFAASIAEYPLTDSLSQHSHPRDSSDLASRASQDAPGLPVIRGQSAGR